MKTPQEKKIEKLEELIKDIRTVLEPLPELNMGNYDDDQVRELNNGIIELSQLMEAFLQDAHHNESELTVLDKEIEQGEQPKDGMKESQKSEADSDKRKSAEEFKDKIQDILKYDYGLNGEEQDYIDAIKDIMALMEQYHKEQQREVSDDKKFYQNICHSLRLNNH